jgi:nitrogen fixation protein
MHLTRRQALAFAALPLPTLTGEEQIRADFAAGRVVVINGWLLARSEVPVEAA